MNVMYYESPIGLILLASEQDTLIKVDIVQDRQDNPKFCFFLSGIIDLLKQYFNKEIRDFPINLKIDKSDFETKVLEEVRQIPYGKTLTSKDIAVKLNIPRKIKSVELAVRSNDILLLIPCHRVVSHTRSSIPYKASTRIQKFLLDLEK